jgi:DNA polymerase-3 subunit gamma/tau
MRRLQDWTGMRWMVTLSREAGAPSLVEQAEAKNQAAAVGVRADPLVRRVLDFFPGAEIVAVRTAEPEIPAARLAPLPREESDEIAYSDSIYTEDDL